MKRGKGKVAGKGLTKEVTLDTDLKKGRKESFIQTSEERSF